jgi:hypothetical protein
VVCRVEHRTADLELDPQEVQPTRREALGERVEGVRMGHVAAWRT